MCFSKFRRGFSSVLYNIFQWKKGDLFCLATGYQIQTRNCGQDQYFLVYNPIRWEYDDNLGKHVLSWFDQNGQKVISTSGELYEEELAYEEYVAKFYG